MEKDKERAKKEKKDFAYYQSTATLRWHLNAKHAAVSTQTTAAVSASSPGLNMDVCKTWTTRLHWLCVPTWSLSVHCSVQMSVIRFLACLAISSRNMLHNDRLRSPMWWRCGGRNAKDWDKRKSLLVSRKKNLNTSSLQQLTTAVMYCDMTYFSSLLIPV